MCTLRLVRFARLVVQTVHYLPRIQSRVRFNTVLEVLVDVSGLPA
jgi:hypothetical protein